MSYTVLARRYRSSTFDEVVGQDHIAQTLKKAIDSGRVAHAYLFCGTRGTGKTSTARILAKCLNCQSSGSPVTKPCDKCESCLSIARGDAMDVVEIDAASNTQVDKTREVVIENAAYRPAFSRFKIYIIDEVHMLSKSSFNALLKTLEEPPEHVKFILATTEPEKIPNTILSRCQRYDFRNIPTREIAEHLKRICREEKIKADDDALLLVAKAGAGSMRDALSLLDRLLSIGEKQLTVAMIEQLLGLPRAELVMSLAQAIGEGGIKQVLTRAECILAGGLSLDGLVASLIDHLRNLLILKACGAESNLVEVPGVNQDDLLAQAERFEAAVLSQNITILEQLRRQARQSGAGRALLDATLVRLALAEQFASMGELLSRVEGTTTTPPGQKKKPEPVAERAAAPAPPGATLVSPSPMRVAHLGDTSVAPTAQTPLSEDDGGDDLPRPGKVWDSSGPSLSELLKQQRVAETAPPAPEPIAASTPAAADANVEVVNPDDLPTVWRSLLDLLAEKGPGLPGLLSHGRFIGMDEQNRAVIRYAKQHETFVKMFERNGKKDQVREAFSKVLKQNVGIAFDLEPDEGGGAPVATMPAPVQPPSMSPASGSIKCPPSKAAPTAPVRREIPSPPAPAAIRPTQEQIEALRASEPLIKALMDDMGANIMKIEEQ
ncbi:MAG TPA: DNA polymerase III subunit gamma/tau [Tepidisphaeraceae bacterium]|nr:DNA polymerase III subunit gamma/tau [Tepidisphaeraceae bacterium]